VFPAFLDKRLAEEIVYLRLQLLTRSVYRNQLAPNMMHPRASTSVLTHKAGLPYTPRI
jgi:hypothetical protein